MFESVEGHGNSDVVAIVSAHHLPNLWTLTDLGRCEQWVYSNDKNSTELPPSPSPRVHACVLGRIEGKSFATLINQPVEYAKAMLDVAICE